MNSTISLFVALVLLTAGASAHDVFSRWRRQAINCQPGDDSCKQCSTGCSKMEASRLPECCEAYNACCDEYFEACKQCSKAKSIDRYFPEYCCASFTSCCDLISTFTTEVKAPAPARPKPKKDLEIPEVAAPKPTAFPGSQPSTLTNQEPVTDRQSLFQDSEFAARPVPVAQGPPPRPQDSIFAPQRPSFDPRSPVGQSPVSRQPSPTFSGNVPIGGPVLSTEEAVSSQRQRTRTQARAQARPQTRGRQTAQRRPTKSNLDPASRRGRVTSRGRVTA